MASIQDALRRGQKIEAVKIHREHSGLGLKEAKDAVEMIEKEMGPPVLEMRQGPKSEKGCLGLILLLLGLLAIWV